MNDYEQLSFNQYQENGFWIFFCITIVFFTILFFRLMIRRKNIQKEISPDILDKAYNNDFKNAKERISKCENQWQLDNAVYSISRFQHTYYKVKDRLLLEQDVNKLIKMWDEKKEFFELSPLLIPKFS